MYFKKYHNFSQNPDQGGGELGLNQKFDSYTWGYIGCPQQQQENLTVYVKRNLKDVVFCRYGLEYLKQFPRMDDLAIGSYKINLDYLMFQKQKHLNTDNIANLIGMSFLKTKGQIQQNQFQMNQDLLNSGNKNNQGVSNIIIPYYKNVQSEDEQCSLQFDSVFESGNLAIALKVSENEYNCILQNDINTNGHTQWFYFKVTSNFSKKTQVKINLINLYKSKSLYQYGMKILMLDVTKESSNEQDQKLPDWERCGIDISYSQNRFTNEQCHNGLFQISFTHEFDIGHKEIYFSHSMPYTYSMLNQYLNSNVTKEKAKRQTLCYSLAGNKVEYLYITGKPKIVQQADPIPIQTDFDLSSPLKTAEKEELMANSKQNSPVKRTKSLTKKEKPKKQQVKQDKQVLMFTSRIHPGETNASWMIQGLMDVLLNPQDEQEEELANNLKDNFEIYITPMLNVDGVINGNYRCSLAACDLNRKWTKPSKTLHPSVYYTQKLCEQIIETDKKQFFLYLDFHGHSAKKNVFQFGNRMEGLQNNGKSKNQFNHPTSLFPLVLSKQFDYFQFQECTFSMAKSKESTARVTMFQKLKIPFVYTLEASFAGASKGSKAGQHFSQKDFTNIGKHVLKAIWDIKQLEMNKNLLKQITEEANLISKLNCEEKDDSDGESSSDDDIQITMNIKKEVQILPTEQLLEGIQKNQQEPNIENGNVVNQQLNLTKPRFAFGNTLNHQKMKNQAGKTFINLKTIQAANEIIVGGGIGAPPKSQSPRKAELYNQQKLKNQKQNGLIQPLHRSSLKPFGQKNSQKEEDQSFSDQLNKQKGSDNNTELGGSPYSQQRFNNISNLVQSKQSEQELKFDLQKNMLRTETTEMKYDDFNHEANDNSIDEFQNQQLDLFEQLNKEIKKSFEQQQLNLDQIFKQTANKFMSFNNQGNGIKIQQRMNIQEKYGKQKSDFEKYLIQYGGQIFQDQLNKNEEKTSKFQQYLSQEKYFEQFEQNLFGQNSKNQKSKTNQSSLQKQPAQIETLLQLQNLHQMQKLNQISQMQFFRQQSELLLNQNLPKEKQLELLQQFSLYQQQIQIQNQQYQMMLSDSFHECYLNNLKQGIYNNSPSKNYNENDNHFEHRNQIKGQSIQNNFYGSKGDFEGQNMQKKLNNTNQKFNKNNFNLQHLIMNQIEQINKTNQRGSVSHQQTQNKISQIPITIIEQININTNQINLNTNNNGRRIEKQILSPIKQQQELKETNKKVERGLSTSKDFSIKKNTRNNLGMSQYQSQVISQKSDIELRSNQKSLSKQALQDQLKSQYLSSKSNKEESEFNQIIKPQKKEPISATKESRKNTNKQNIQFNQSINEKISSKRYSQIEQGINLQQIQPNYYNSNNKIQKKDYNMQYQMEQRYNEAESQDNKKKSKQPSRKESIHTNNQKEINKTYQNNEYGEPSSPFKKKSINKNNQSKIFNDQN